MAKYDVNWSATLASVAGTVTLGQCLVSTTAGYVVATTANRTTYGKPDGIAATSGDARNSVEMIQVGPLTSTQTGLGTGLEGPVRVSAAGVLERVATPSGSDVVVGWCWTDGRAFVGFGGILTWRNFVDQGGGGAGSPGGSSGDLQTNAGGGLFGGITPGSGVSTWLATPSGANLATALTTALPATKGGTGLTSLAAGIATWLGTSSGANLASALTSALPDTKGGTGLTALGTGVATWLGTPSGANLASALTTALPDTKGGTGLTALGTGVATFLGTPTGANLASALTTALPDTKGGTGLTALGSGVATFLGTPSGANLASALTTALPISKGGTGHAGTASAMGALAIDWTLSNVFTKTLANGGNTITFSNQASGMCIMVRLTGAGTSTVTWPTVKWAGGAAPTQTAAGTDVYTFVHDGTSVYGSVVQAMA